MVHTHSVRIHAIRTCVVRIRIIVWIHCVGVHSHVVVGICWVSWVIASSIEASLVGCEASLIGIEPSVVGGVVPVVVVSPTHTDQ